MIRNLLIILFFSAFVFGLSAQVLLTGSTYNQDFNSLANSGTTNTTVPAEWVFLESGSSANTTYAAGTGSDNGGNTYSFGAAANSERAFGGLASNNLTTQIGVSFQNNTGSPLTTLIVEYTGEQWRMGVAGTQDSIVFQYSLDATSISTGTWTNYVQLNFKAPITTGTAGALNGNVAPNRSLRTSTITALNIPNGAKIWFRWSDINVAGTDHSLAIDDFSISTTSAPTITATQLVMSGVPPTAETGVPFDITICAQDAMNNTQSDYVSPITLTQTAGTPATITPTSPQVPVGGCITYTITPTAPNEIISFSTTSGMLTPDASGDINVIQGQSACYTDNCDYSIVPVTLNIENDNWTCSAGSYTVNGYSTTASPSELWLISPQYLWNATNANFTADVVESFDGSTLEVSYSTNYSGNPATATWVSIGTYTASATLNIAVPAITPGSNLVFGFKYTATGLAAGSSQYVVSNIVLKSTECANISITSCDISDLTNANSSSCNDNGTPSNPVDDYFTTDISVNYSNPPATGTLGLYKDNGLTLLTSIPVGSLTPITHVFVGVQLPADGNNIPLVAKFSETPTCSFSKVITGISNCSNTPAYIELLPAPAASVYLGEQFDVNLCFTDGAGNPISAPMYATLIVDISPNTTLSLTNTSGTGPCFTYTFNPTEVGMATVSFYDDNFDFFTSFNINVLPQPCSDIFISEIADQDTTGNNKYIEIFNASSSPINIGGYKVNIYANGSISPTAITIPVSTMIAAKDVFVIRNSGANPAIYSLCTSNIMTSGSVSINGDDVVELTNGTDRLDIYGVIGEVPANNVSWNYVDKNAQRDPNLQCGRRSFNLSEWYIAAVKSGPKYTTPCSNCLMPTEGAA